MTLSWPSPLPTEVGTGVFACGAVSPLVPLLPLPPPDEPHAATSTAAEAAASSMLPRAHFFIWPYLSLRAGKAPALVMDVVGLGFAPGDVYCPSPGLERFGGRGLQVLAYRGDLAA